MKNIEQKVLRFIEQNNLISANDKILIAFSGGPDSVFALNFFSKFKKKFKIQLCAVHFNHQLRGEESDNDEIFSIEACKKLKVPIEIKRINVKTHAAQNKLSVEEAARILRYNNLKLIAAQRKCNKVITAHNQSDNTETILLNMFSGTGISGLSGIPVQRLDIIRPLLCLPKQEILEYLEKSKIQFRIDSSNLSDDFKRNFIRNRILPLVKQKINPSIDEALFRSSQNLNGTLLLNDRLINHIISEYITHSSDTIQLPLLLPDIFGGIIPGDILKVVLRKFLKHEFDHGDFIKINSLIKIQKGKIVELSKDLIAVREEDSIRIGIKKLTANDRLELKINSQCTVENQKVGIDLADSNKIKFEKNGKVEFISGDKLKGNFIVRRWTEGDKFIPLGMKNFKKVSDFLTDLKMPSSKRKAQLILTNHSQIVWIVGLRIDDRFKLNSKNKKVLKLWTK
jgi:tRNA(Ile)-lysidine synthase